MSEYPLFPELHEDGKKEAEAVIEKFKKRLKAIAEEVLGEVYCDIPTYIESDSWMNFRNALISAFKNYGNRKLQGEYDFKQIREQIYCQFREEIIKDLNQDNLEEIEKLKKEIRNLRDIIEQRPHGCY